jgi:hypothetical protein
MNGLDRIRASACGVAFSMVGLGLHTDALAADLPRFVDATLVCVDGLANKERLAEQLLIKYPISLQAREQALPSGQRSRQRALAVLVKNPDACGSQCQPGDKENAKRVAVELKDLLQGTYAPEFTVDQQTDPSTLLDEAGTANIRCVAMPKKSGTGLFAVVKQRLRIRGNANDLAVPRGEPSLANTDQASLTLKSDEQLHTRNLDGNLVIGWNISPEAENGRRTDVIPYIGANRSSAESNGISKKEDAKDTVNRGVALALFRPGVTWDHATVVRLDYLSDHVDGSRIGSLRAEYTPYRPEPGGLRINVFERIDGKWLPKTFGKLIFSLPFDYGKYTRRKSGAQPGEQPDFGHAGVRAGFALAVDGGFLPVQFTTTYTALRAWHGNIDVNYLKSGLTVSLDEKKYVGLELSYKRGKLEDTFKDEKKWSLELKARY